MRVCVRARVWQLNAIIHKSRFCHPICSRSQIIPRSTFCVSVSVCRLLAPFIAGRNVSQASVVVGRRRASSSGVVVGCRRASSGVVGRRRRASSSGVDGHRRASSGVVGHRAQASSGVVGCRRASSGIVVGRRRASASGVGVVVRRRVLVKTRPLRGVACSFSATVACRTRTVICGRISSRHRFSMALWRT